MIRRLIGSATFLIGILALQIAAPDAVLAQSICAPYPESTLPAGIKQLEFPSAWQKVCGTANVAIVDNGIYPPFAVPQGPLNRVRREFVRDCFNSLACFPSIPAPDEADNGTATTGTSRGHGTHVAGIIGASYSTSNSTTGLAAVGGCRGCSLHIVGVPTLEPYMLRALDEVKFFGSQVVNNSFGLTATKLQDSFHCNLGTHCSEWASKLDDLAARGVVVVGASGNSDEGSTDINFPANHSSVVAVGGADGNVFWSPRTVYRLDGNNAVESITYGSASGSNQWLIAPAVEVPSLFYPASNWAVFTSPSEYSCRDQSLIDPNLPAGFGNCTGTSMAAPYVSAIAALVKSANPLLSAQEAKTILAQSGSNYPSWAPDVGYGIPSASRAVNLALGGTDVINRLTPLFSLLSYDSQTGVYEHLYSVVPQVAMSAIEGTLPPRKPNNVLTPFVPFGNAVPGYSGFPAACTACASLAPRAIASVFTTYRNPTGGPELVPLYRMSCNPEITPQNCQHASYVYALGGEIDAFKSVGYEVDAIDGFIYPETQDPQPANSVKLCRKWDPARDDYILFTGAGPNGADCSATSDGFTTGSNYTQIYRSDWIGYVYSVGTPGPVTATPSTPPPPPNTNLFVNGGMELPQTTTIAGTPTGWIGRYAATVSNSYYGMAGFPAPEGTQAGYFLSSYNSSGSSLGYLEQTLDLQPGTYTLSFKAGLWRNYPTTIPTAVRVRMNGVELVSGTAYGGTYVPISTTVTIAAAGSYTFHFEAIYVPNTSPIPTVLLDDVRIGPM